MESDSEINSLEILTEIYTQYGEELKKRAGRVIKDENLCEDILQDCMIKTIQNISLISSLTKKQAFDYLAVTVDNLTEKYAFHLQNEYLFIDSLSEETFTDLDGVEIFVEKSISRENLNTMLNRLTERDRKIIMMKYIRHMSDREIAPLLDIKENSVRMTVRRSIFHLKKRLGVVKNFETIS